MFECKDLAGWVEVVESNSSKTFRGKVITDLRYKTHAGELISINSYK